MTTALACPALNAALASDPTRTRTLRLRFMQQMTRRWAEIKKDIRISIIDRDCFDIQPEVVAFGATERKAFKFKTDTEKVAGFMDWLRDQEAKGVLQIVERRGGPEMAARLRRGVFPGLVGPEPWTDVWIDSSYQAGIRDGRAKLRRAGVVVPPDEAMGGVGTLFNQPVHADRVAAIYSRCFEDLKTVVEVTNAQVRRKITDGLTTGLARGLAEGKHPRVIARELVKDVTNRVDKIGIVRARAIARSEIIRAHHVAGIGEYYRAQEELGPDVEVKVRILLGRGPCPEGICPDLAAGGPYTLQEAEGMLPAHVNCTCGSIPVIIPVEEAWRAA